MIDYTFSIEEMEYFLLFMTRITAFISVAPFFGMNNTPRRIKVGLGFFIALLLYHTSFPHPPLVYDTILGYSVIVVKEAVTGLIIGFGAQMCTFICTFAGMIIDMNIGLSMVSMMDPSTRENTTISGVYLQYMTMLLLLVSGMYQFLLRALSDTYKLIPINGAVFHADHLVSSIIAFMSSYTMIGFRICLPVFAVIFIMNIVLGILAKVAPQMNMFAVGMQLKIIAGLMTLFLTAFLMPKIMEMIFGEMRVIVTTFVEGLT